MSSVTTTILDLTSELSRRDAMVATINAWLLEHGPPNSIGQFVPLPDPGCPKGMQQGFYYGAFNYLPEMSFVEFLRTLDWAAADSVQVLIKHESDDRFHVHAMRTSDQGVARYVRDGEFLRTPDHPAL